MCCDIVYKSRIIPVPRCTVANRKLQAASCIYIHASDAGAGPIFKRALPESFDMSRTRGVTRLRVATRDRSPWPRRPRPNVARERIDIPNLISVPSRSMDRSVRSISRPLTKNSMVSKVHSCYARQTWHLIPGGIRTCPNALPRSHLRSRDARIAITLSPISPPTA